MVFENCSSVFAAGVRRWWQMESLLLQQKLTLSQSLGGNEFCMFQSPKIPTRFVFRGSVNVWESESGSHIRNFKKKILYHLPFFVMCLTSINFYRYPDMNNRILDSVHISRFCQDFSAWLACMIRSNQWTAFENYLCGIAAVVINKGTDITHTLEQDNEKSYSICQ